MNAFKMIYQQLYHPCHRHRCRRSSGFSSAGPSARYIFIAPKFTRDAEMEFRRRVRMRARFPTANNNTGNTATTGSSMQPCIPPHAIGGGRPVPLTFADLSATESGSSGSGMESASQAVSGSCSSGGGSSVEGKPEEGEEDNEEADDSAEFLAV